MADSSPAIATALRWVQAKNDHNLMRLCSVTDHDAIFEFPDTNVNLPMRAFFDTMSMKFDSIPDLSFTYKSVAEVEPGVVLFTDYIGFGHHTGACLELPPLPPVPATGIYIADEPIQLTVKVRDHKVIRAIADARGQLVGPPGFYYKGKAAYEEMHGKLLM